jgi:PKD domain
MAGWGGGSWGSSRWGIGDSSREHIPTSPEFPSADVNVPDTISILPDYLEVSATRGSPWIVYDPSALGLRVMNDGGLETAIGIDLETSESWTLEVTFRPDQLPPDFSNLDIYRLFIGAYDMQGPGCGVAISRAGLAIMPAPTGSAFPIPGSQSLIPEGNDYYTIRIAVSAELDVTNIYVTKTSLIPIKGHQLRFTTNAIQSPPDSSDGVIIDPLGTGSIPVQITLQTVRFNGHAMMVPNQRPVAVPGPDQGVSIGATVRFDGSGSYDPEGSPLTYFWSLVDAPDGSQFKTTGTDGNTSPDFNNDGFTYFFDDPDIGGPSNTGMFSADNAPVLQPGDTLIVGGQQYTVAVGVAGQIPMWVRVPTSTKWVRNIAGGGWIDTRIAITEELLPDNLSNQPWIIYHSATFFDNQTHEIPEAIPDAPGLYEPQLVVNDGELDSIPEFALLNVAQTALTMGVIPDVSFIWRHLSNFWSLIEDRDKVETVWSGFAQAAANILMTAWQIDYNKSLKDIQRVFQRRWLEYSTFLSDDPDSAKVRIVRGGICSGFYGPEDVAGKTLEFVFDNGKIETVTFTGTPSIPLSTAEMAAQVNEQLGFSTQGTPLASVRYGRSGLDWLAFDYPTLLRLTPNGTANSSLGFSTTAYTQNDLQSIRVTYASTPVISSFPPVPQVNIQIQENFEDTVNVAAGVPTYDLSYYGIGSEDLFIATVSYPPSVPPDRLALRIKNVGLSSNYQAVLGTPPRALGIVLSDPIPTEYVPTSPSIGHLVMFHDWLIPSVVVSTVNDFTEQLISVGDLARFEVTPIATGVPTIVHCPVVGVAHERLGFNPAPLLMYYNGRPQDFNTTFLGMSRLTNVPVDSLVVEIPRLQEVIKDPPSFLTGNKDYIITEVDGQNTIQFTPGTYSIGDPPPDTLWAEITYLNNNPAIEGNFGTLVGLTAAEATGIAYDLDYLSAVRGLWFAYFGGPAIENIRIGIQILLGLPFAEEAGVVDSITPNFSATQGRIFLHDVSNPAIVRGYFYPTTHSLGLAINQETGKTIAVNDKIDQFAPLSTGVEVLDWVKGAEWGAAYGAMFSEVEKFFRFAVRLNVDAFSLANIDYAIKFVQQIKPHYTYPTFIVLKNIDNDTKIDVVDQQTATVYKKIVSTPDTENIGAYRYDDDIAGDAFAPPHDDLYTDGVCQQRFDAPFYGGPYFGFDRPILFPDTQMSVLASSELSGPLTFDSIWAYDDGGGMDVLPLSGPAPTPPPPPYGPLVGLVTFDMALPPGIYSRGWYL